MKKIFPWIALFLAFILIFYLVFQSPVLNYGGDIAEYHGITETIIKSGSIHLTPVAEYNLKQYLPSAYFDNPGYYITGVDGLRYPVHFILYSILAIPIRLILHLFSINELQTLRLTNVLILFGAIAFTFKYLLKNDFKRMILLGVIIVSPLMFFLSWPGPDIFYLSLLLIATLLFLEKNYISAGIFTAIASSHSQPLTVLSLLMGFFGAYKYFKYSSKNTIALPKMRFILQLGLIPFILAIPVFYNVLFFGALSPWTKLQDGWTILNGFGLQNISLQKFSEQFLDLNLGIFFYAPMFILTGLYFVWKYRHNLDVVFLFIAFLITAFFYQTNPAWHYGTAGYGPSRHAIFFLPLFIVFFVFFMQKTFKHYFLLVIFILLQIPILSMNRFTNPDLTKTLYHNQYAQFVLDRWPELYNPTPEIFVDRTNHTDLDYPTSAVYKTNGQCKKAYALITDISAIKTSCGSVPKKYESLFDDSLSRKSNTYRTTLTNSATFWPDSESCKPDYNGPYICMKNLNDFIKYTGVELSDRIIDLKNGVWRIDMGSPVSINVPPGYFIHYNSFKGHYINF